RLPHADTRTFVTLGGPAISRMGFAYVDHEERGPVPIAMIQLLEVAGLAPKRTAREIAKHENDRLGSGELRERDLLVAIDGSKCKVGDGLIEPWARLQRTELLAKQAADERGFRRRARARLSRRRRGQRPL